MDYLNVDYHFHPFLPKNSKKAFKKSKRWWNYINRLGIDVMIVTEHVYCNPERAFDFLNKTKPKNKFCFPGMEYITKEGIDIIIFSKDKYVFKKKELKPYNLNLKETIDLILEDKKLFSYVTHPYSLSRTNIRKHVSNRKYKEIINKLRAIEICNGGFNSIISFFIFSGLSLFLKEILKNIKIPLDDYPKDIKFLAVGSDAHTFRELGIFAKVIKKDNKNIF